MQCSYILSFQCYSIPGGVELSSTLLNEVSEKFLTELKKQSEAENDLESGRLLEIPESLDFYISTEEPSDELKKVLDQRFETAEVIERQPDDLTCGTLEKPCVYVLTGREFFKNI